MTMSFPNETPEYRAARNAILASEIGLRRQMEAVAAQLRALPPGGEVQEDYVFEAARAEGASTAIRMSELFRGGDTRPSNASPRSHAKRAGGIRARSAAITVAMVRMASRCRS